MKCKFMFLILIICVLLSACGQQAEPVQTVVAELKTVEPFALDETLRMINAVGENRALIHGSKLYTLAFDGDYNPVLAVYDLKGGELGEGKVLADNCAPEGLTVLEDRLYYVNSTAGDVIESISLNGGDRQILVDKACKWLQVFESQLYYCDENGTLFSSSIDGSLETELISRCFYPFVFDGAILYQSGSDGERLHFRWTEDGEDYAVSAQAAYAPVIIEDKIYYTGSDGIYSINLNGTEPKKYQLPQLYSEAEIYPLEGDCVFRGVTDDKGLYQWTVELGELDFKEAEYIGYKLCDYMDENYRVETHYYTDGRIRSFLLTAADGTETEYMSIAEAEETE